MSDVFCVWLAKFLLATRHRGWDQLVRSQQHRSTGTFVCVGITEQVSQLTLDLCWAPGGGLVWKLFISTDERRKTRLSCLLPQQGLALSTPPSLPTTLNLFSDRQRQLIVPPKLFRGAILFYSWAVSGVLSSPVMFLGGSSRTSAQGRYFFLNLQVSITLVSQCEDLFWSNSKILSWSVKGRFGCLGDESKSFQAMLHSSRNGDGLAHCEELNTLLMSPFPSLST